MPKVGTLEVDLRTNVAKFAQGMDQANRKLSAFGKQASILRNTVVGIFSVLAVKRIADFTEGIVEAADQTAKAARTVALATDSFQGLAHGFDLAGISQQQFTQNMIAFVKRVGEARSNTGPLVTFLAKYDTELLKNIQHSRNQEEALKFVAEAIKNAATETDRAAIANAFFSRAGVQMKDAIKGGAGAIDEMIRSAKEAGLVIDSNLLAKAEETNDKFTILSKTIKVQVTSAILELSDDIQDLVKWLGDATRTLATFIDTFKDVKNSNNIRRLTEDLTALYEAREKNLQTANNPNWLQKFLGNDKGAAAAAERQLKSINEIIDRLTALNAPKITTQGAGTTGGVETPIVPNLTDTEKQFNDMFNRLSDKEAEYQANRIQRQKDTDQALLDSYRDYGNKQAELQKSVANYEIDLKQNVVSQSIGLLQTLGANNKNFARAAIILEKAVALAQIQVSFEVAKAKTFAAYGATPVGFAAVGKLELLKNLSLGLVAATGIAQLAQLNQGSGGGGAPLGSVSNPVNVTQNTSANAPARPGGTTIININGLAADSNALDELAYRMAEAADRGDLILVKRNSRNAIDLR